MDKFPISAAWWPLKGPSDDGKRSDSLSARWAFC